MNRIIEWYNNCDFDTLAIGSLFASSLVYTAYNLEESNQILPIITTLGLILYSKDDEILDLSPLKTIHNQKQIILKGVSDYLKENLISRDYKLVKRALANINPKLALCKVGKHVPMNKIIIPVVVDEYNEIIEIDLEYIYLLDFISLHEKSN